MDAKLNTRYYRFCFVIQAVLLMLWTSHASTQLRKKFSVPLESREDGFGKTALNIGDVNGDLVDDILVGSPEDSRIGTQMGSVSALSGTDYSIIWKRDGDELLQKFGSRLERLRDVDDDGVDEIVITTNEAHASKKVYVLSGKSGTTLTVFQGKGESFGHIAKDVGDVDKDGYHDLIVTEPSFSTKRHGGRIFIYSVKKKKILSSVKGKLKQFLGGLRFGEFGISATGLGDINKDGHADYAVGAPREPNNRSDSGAVHIFSGKNNKLIKTLRGYGLGIDLGLDLGSLHDYNGDKIPDFYVGSAPNGKILQIYSGKRLKPISKKLKLARHLDFAPFDLDFNYDVDGDGTKDIIVIHIDDDSNQTVRAFSGKKFAPLWESQILGNRVTGVSDKNGDSVPDFLVTDRYVKDGPYRRKRTISIISGANGVKLDDIAGESFSDDRLSDVVEFVGDINNDGISDLLYAIVVPIYPDEDTPVGESAYPRVVKEVRAVSGLDGSLIWSNTDDTAMAQGRLDADFVILGDVDGDGIRDYKFGQQADEINNGTSANTATFKVYSGRSGQILDTLTFTHTQFILEAKIWNAGDTDNDGIDELLVVTARSGWSFYNKFSMIRNLSVAELQSAATALFSESSKFSIEFEFLETLKDVNNDGIKDFLIRNTRFASNETRRTGVSILSGSDLSAIAVNFNVPTEYVDDLDIGALDDYTGDGIPEVFSLFGGNVAYFSLPDGIELGKKKKSKGFGAYLDVVCPTTDIDKDGFNDLIGIGSYAHLIGISSAKDSLIFDFQPSPNERFVPIEAGNHMSCIEQNGAHDIAMTFLQTGDPYDNRPNVTVYSFP